jgi:voltage-gated potassium channel Kch
MSRYRFFSDMLPGLRSALADQWVRRLLVITLSLIAAGSIFFWLVEGWSLLDAIYFSVITLATVGYGDLVPKTIPGKIFTMAYVLSGVGIFVATAAALAEHLISRAQNRDEKK